MTLDDERQLEGLEPVFRGMATGTRLPLPFRTGETLAVRCGLLSGANEWLSPQSTEASLCFKFQEKDTHGTAVVVRPTSTP